MKKKAFICPNCDQTVFLNPGHLAIDRFEYLQSCPECKVKLAFPFYVVLAGVIILLAVCAAGLALTYFALPFLFDPDPMESEIGELQLALVSIPSVLLGMRASSLFYQYPNTIIVRKPRPWQS